MRGTTEASNERFGVALGIASCCCGAGAAVATRHLVGTLDPITIAAIRFGGGALCVLPIAIAVGARFPSRADWPAVAALGFAFYALFFIAYNLALRYTTVARGTLALSTLPLMTMLVAALLGRESLSLRKSLGVLLAMAGVSFALASGLAAMPAGAWRGDLLMVSATLCMAFYSIWSRPFARRSSSLGFLAAGMSVGGLALVVLTLATARVSVEALSATDWTAAIYLAAGGGALAFILWVYALDYASPTRVTNTMTVNPLVAGVGAAVLLGEPVTIALAIGLIGVFAGIWIATTERT
jgi:drug/metabolite transporter (DMT)-like permease